MKVLQIGVGSFGKNHLRVWNELNEDLFAADLLPQNLDACRTYRMPSDRVGRDYRQFLPLVDAVDIVTSTDSHYQLCREALEAGKDVFVEKPFTSTSAQARELWDLAERKGRVIQVGHLFRYNPATRLIRGMIEKGELGPIHYIYGTYAGFKRMRTDVGVTQTDSIHYFDVANFLLDAFPQKVVSVQKDTRGRGLEDVSVTFLHYGETLVKVESGYHHPEPRRDLVLIGEKKTVEADLVKQYLRIHNNTFAKKGQEWVAVHDGVSSPSIKFEEPLRNELIAFRECVEKRKAPLAGPRAGWQTLVLVEAARRSAQELRAVDVAAEGALKEAR
jgi:UDP-N-acetylglucosamine 3-dehydrogenase